MYAFFAAYVDDIDILTIKVNKHISNFSVKMTTPRILSKYVNIELNTCKKITA